MIILAIHAGVGTFKEHLGVICSSALKNSCKKKTIGNNTYKEESILVMTVMELEKCPSLNCGIGSNLTEKGTVECEAAFICSDFLAFGAVAAVTNCVHPIYAARKIADPYRFNSPPNRLIEPMILIGAGADEFCKFLGVGIIENENLRTKAAKKDHLVAKNIIAITTDSNDNNSEKKNLRLDTVGGVLINNDTGYAEACVSSGGLLLKKQGRVGHSAHFGAGIWAEQRDNISVAITLSGCGEAIIRTQLAEKLAQYTFSLDFEDPFLLEHIRNFLKLNFSNSSRLVSFSRDRLLLGGLLLIKSDANVILVAFHNSQHIPFAFIGTNQKINKIESKNDKIGEFLCISFNL